MRRRLVLALVLVPAALACGPKSRTVEMPKRARLERACGLTAEPLTRAQALCVAHEAKVGLVEGELTLEEGTTVEREPIWIVRENCPAGAAEGRCVEIWIRRSDGRLVNTRHLYAFDGYERLPG